MSATNSTDAKLPVALDTMGGDHGAKVQVDGAAKALKREGLSSILVGPKEDLESICKSLGIACEVYSQERGLVARDTLYIAHAPEVITMEDSPARAIRKKPDSSMCVAYQLVIDGAASAVLSSGNSGAMMAAGRILGGLMPGIERPAIATLIPTVGDGNPNVVMDSGANVDCHAQNFVQFAVMGSIYCQSLFGVEKPRVALLSNGSESSKGTDVIRSASALLTQMDRVNYVGYVEGRDVTQSKAEVIVCDGFVGNVLLKAMEGCVTLIYRQILHEQRGRLLGRLGLGLARPILRAVFKDKFDHASVGGAPLLGLRHLALVLHGSSDSKAVNNAISLAHSFVEKKMTENIVHAVARLEERLDELDGGFVSGMMRGSMNGGSKNGKGESGKRVEASDSSAE